MADKSKDVDLHALLRQRYSNPAWAFCFEVPDGTSDNKRRTIDALAMGCWRSEGIHLHGFEIKHSRSDWLKELDSPDKQMTWMPYLHRFWIVAVKGIVKPEELPAEWGLMENRGSGLKVSSAASLMKPKDIPHKMLAAIMRRILNASNSREQLQAEYRRGYSKGKEDGKSSRTMGWAQQVENDLTRLREKVRAFEESSGVKITGWEGRNVGPQFRAFQTLNAGAWDNCLNVAKRFIEAAEAVSKPE